MDISKQIDKELVEVKAVLMEALSQKKTGARQAAPGKTDTRTTRRVPLAKATEKGAPNTMSKEQFQSWEMGFKNKMLRDAMQRVDPKIRCNLITAEQLQMMMNSKELK